MLRALPWIAILAIITVVQVIRGVPADAIIFGVAAAVITVDAAAAPRVPAIRVPAVAVLIGAVASGALLVIAPRHGVLAGIVVAIVGVAAVVIAWPNPRSARGARRVGPDLDPDLNPDPGRRRGAILWAAVTVALCLLELSSFLLGRFDADSKLTHPAVSDLLDPLLDTWPGRIAFIVLWLAAGVGFVRSGRRT